MSSIKLEQLVVDLVGDVERLLGRMSDLENKVAKLPARYASELQ